MISLKNKSFKRSTLVLGLLMVTSILFLINSFQPIEGSEFISSSSDMETFVVKDLENGKTYEFLVSYDSIISDYDIGFAIYNNDNFKDKNKVLTQDDPGDGFEAANYTAISDGDVYLGVWMNENDIGFVDITVTEQGTSNEMTIEDYYESIWSSLRWVWIMLGSIVGFAIIFGIIIFIVFIRAASKHAVKVKDALVKGIALPRHGRKKNKCPFCNVKLPPESMVTCPYCGAPITD
ncbi:MAG: hypothetical protein E3J70_06065 [Candidatus Heimdallarchaeota archaeon]|nr:MAG: hypothetical protein E3J70_06065 [Candidatus Heimdallarchaeota archaeon]